jgi:hypothetical protein
MAAQKESDNSSPVLLGHKPKYIAVIAPCLPAGRNEAKARAGE